MVPMRTFCCISPPCRCQKAQIPENCGSPRVRAEAAGLLWAWSRPAAAGRVFRCCPGCGSGAAPFPTGAGAFACRKFDLFRDGEEETAPRKSGTVQDKKEGPECNQEPKRHRLWQSNGRNECPVIACKNSGPAEVNRPILCGQYKKEACKG